MVLPILTTVLTTAKIAAHKTTNWPMPGQNPPKIADTFPSERAATRIETSRQPVHDIRIRHLVPNNYYVLKHCAVIIIDKQCTQYDFAIGQLKLH